MTLLQMQYFREVCRCKSTLKASQSLSVSQSAVSTSIKLLEKELAVTLFERTSKGMVPTAAGERFLARSEAILDQTEALEREMQRFSLIQRPIRLGIPVQLNHAHWPELYFRLKQRFPDMEFQSINRTVSTLMELLEKGEVDCVLALRPSEPPARYSVLLGVEHERHVSMSISNPLACRERLTYRDLLDCPVLGYAGDTVQTTLTQKEYAKYGRTLHYAHRFDQIATLLQFLRRNTGVAFIRKDITDAYDDLVSIPLEDMQGNYYLCLLWDQNSLVNRLPKGFLGVFREYFEPRFQAEERAG